jgi:TatD DNase family protein
MFIDTHAHLNFKDFDVDYDKVIEDAFSNNVKAIINVGSNLKTSKKAVEIAKKYQKGVYAAVGLHPIHVNDEKFDEEVYLKLAKDKKVVALGKTGLDYYYDRTHSDLQKDIFQRTLRIAQELSKPVILHSREAQQDLMTLLMTNSLLPRGVMHCFTSEWNMAKIILDMGFFLSFTGLITFTKNYENLEVVKNTPIDRIMIETDCPFMAPNPYRGKRNIPSFVVEVAKKIAEIKKIPLEKVEDKTTKNAIELFNLDLK